MTPYMSSGFPCRRGQRVCRWRVMPASGDPEHLRDAAWDRVRHEKLCPFPDDPATPQPREERPARSRTIDDVATYRAAVDVDEERDYGAVPTRVARVLSPTLRCGVCRRQFPRERKRGRPFSTCPRCRVRT